LEVQFQKVAGWACPVAITAAEGYLNILSLEIDKNRTIWVWGKSKVFSVKTMYAHLWREEVENHKKIWKSKSPLTIKIFMWLIQLNAILTKDTWQGDKRCSFCNQDESVKHLFFECFLAKYVWSMVAKIIGADCRPINFEQYWPWCKKYLPNYKTIHMDALSLICWAFRRSRKSVCFHKKVC
jgi:hypothetical protein